MRSGSELQAALLKVRLISVHGPWTRVVRFRHLLGAPGGKQGPPQPLWGGAAALAGGRFTPKGGFDSVYLAWDASTALAEVNSVIMLPGLSVSVRTEPQVLLTVDGVISRVIDLTDDTTLQTLGTNPQEITGAWRAGEDLPTKALGRAAYDSGKIAGIKYPSTKNQGGINLVVFPDRLTASATDFLEVYDPHNNLTQRIGV